MPINFTDADKLYLNTALGRTLKETLTESVQSDMITEELSETMLKEFNRLTLDEIRTNVKAKCEIKGKVNWYRRVEDVWTIQLKDVSINDGKTEERVEELNVIGVQSKRKLQKRKRRRHWKKVTSKKEVI